MSSVEKILLYFIIGIAGVLLYIFAFKKHVNKHNEYQKYLVLSIIPIVIFVRLAAELIEKELTTFDDEVYHFVSMVISNKLTFVMKIISNLSSSIFVVIVLILAIFILIKTKKEKIYWQVMIFNLATVILINQALKYAFARQRPDILRLVDASGFSFPSGHAMVSVCFYGYIVYLILMLYKSKMKYLYSGVIAITILLIGISRIYLGVHYASDVAAGYFAGLSTLLISCTIATFLNDRKPGDKSEKLV